MHIKVRGIVVLETDFSEHDKYIDILTYTHGKISVYCRGVRRKNSPLASKTRLMSYGEFEIFHSKNRYSLNDATVIESFFEVSNDIVDFSLCSYFLQVASRICIENDDKTARTLISSLYALVKQKKDHEFVKAVFELRIMADSGFSPVIDRCFVCGETENLKQPAFDLVNGGICCESCQNNDQNKIFITNSVLKAMNHILNCDVKKLFSFEVKGQSFEILCEIAENYLKIQTDYHFKTLDFYKMLL